MLQFSEIGDTFCGFINNGAHYVNKLVYDPDYKLIDLKTANHLIGIQGNVFKSIPFFPKISLSIDIGAKYYLDPRSSVEFAIVLKEKVSYNDADMKCKEVLKGLGNTQLATAFYNFQKQVTMDQNPDTPVGCKFTNVMKINFNGYFYKGQIIKVWRDASGKIKFLKNLPLNKVWYE